ncbi:MAG TPA: protein phosphatase 2C domain-containing protein [Ktedonobacteraceae bacterium]|nr:protein phosphatase 2C domain-containing protein [Ktedonobacteraceae bacterium]
MLAQTGMLEHYKASYRANPWVRRGTLALLVVASILLASLTGGFPPWAWRLLFRVLPTLSRLWAMRGLAILPALLSLSLLSLTLFVIWTVIVLLALRMALYWWRERELHQSFEDDLQDARSQVSYNDEPTVPEPVASAPARTSRNVRFDVQPPSYQYSSYGSYGNYSSSSSNPYYEYSEASTVPIAVAEPETPSGTSSVYLEASTGLDAGVKRKGQPNEDNLLALPSLHTSKHGPQPVGLFVVADGMGGHGNGKEASTLAIEAFRKALDLALSGMNDELDDATCEEILAEAVHNANLAVYQRNRQKQADMGTTLTAALVIGNTAYIANVGDSRTYLYRESDGLVKITQDHSTVARLVEMGAITQDEVYTHPRRNEIYRSLGNRSSVKVDTYVVPLMIDDLLVLCSDGVWEMVRDSQIEQIIQNSASYTSQICDLLVQAAINGGGKDNISVIVAAVRQQE